MKSLTPDQQIIVLKYKPIVEGWIAAKYFGNLLEEKQSDAFFALCKAVAAWEGEYNEDFVKYLKTAVFNQWKQSFNREVYQTQRRDGAHEDVYAAEEADAGALASREPGPDFRALIAEMPERERKILDLKAVGFTAKEIASAIGKSRATAYRRIAETRKNLGKLFG